MNRHFTPQNIQRSPVPNHSRFPSFQQPFSPSLSQRSPFGSPQPSPNFYTGSNALHYDNKQRSNFELPNPNIASPQFHSSPRNGSPRAYSPRNGSPRPYSPRNRSPYASNNSSFNSSYSNQSNHSAGSSFNSSSNYADISGSSYSPYNNQKRKFHKNSNPGHSDNIEDYIHPSMLEDPWKKDMIEYERKKKLSENKPSSDS